MFNVQIVFIREVSVFYICTYVRVCVCVPALLEMRLSCVRSASEETMTVLEEVIMLTFQQCVYYLTKVYTHTHTHQPNPTTTGRH